MDDDLLRFLYKNLWARAKKPVLSMYSNRTLEQYSVLIIFWSMSLTNLISSYHFSDWGLIRLSTRAELERTKTTDSGRRTELQQNDALVPRRWRWGDLSRLCRGYFWGYAVPRGLRHQHWSHCARVWAFEPLVARAFTNLYAHTNGRYRDDRSASWWLRFWFLRLLQLMKLLSLFILYSYLLFYLFLFSRLAIF